MARRLAWSNLRGGVIAVVAIVGIAVATLKYARVGALHGDRIRVYAALSAARGVLRGSEVWLLGQKVGRIADIRFRSPSESDTSTRVLIEMELLEQYREAIHRDAVAQIRPGGSVIGAMVVYLTPGTPEVPLIAEGDTVHARPQSDVEHATAQFGAVTRELPALIKDVKAIRSELQSTRGTLGALRNGSSSSAGPRQAAAERMRTLRARFSSERGSLARITSGPLRARAQQAMARADSVRALVGSTSTSLGRFRHDSTLVAEIADVRDELAEVRAALAESRGTAGRVLHDSAAFSALGDVHREMALLVADLKKHPLRYSPF
jgi:phospholipid/cholesterol/gamma-HCH transport system substrate-binding protein